MVKHITCQRVSNALNRTINALKHTPRVFWHRKSTVRMHGALAFIRHLLFALNNGHSFSGLQVERLFLLLELSLQVPTNHDLTSKINQVFSLDCPPFSKFTNSRVNALACELFFANISGMTSLNLFFPDICIEYGEICSPRKSTKSSSDIL